MRERTVLAYAANPASWHAKYLRESMARAEGDVDTIIAIYAAELDDHGRNHFRIASELDGAGRGGEALRWAERGLREAAHPDQQLADYLARRYAAAGRQADVLDLRRDRFQAERSLTSYQALREAATACGVASLLLSARACHRALGTADDFRPYVAALRAEQKRKRNLMKILDQNGL